jgi:hypothetical protein
VIPSVPKEFPQYEKPKTRKPAVIPADVLNAPKTKKPQFVRLYGNQIRTRSKPVH